MSSSAASQQFDINVLVVMAAPVMLFVLIYFIYALVVWRHREGDDEDGPPIHGNTRCLGDLDRRHRCHRAQACSCSARSS